MKSIVFADTCARAVPIALLVFGLSFAGAAFAQSAKIPPQVPPAGSPQACFNNAACSQAWAHRIATRAMAHANQQQGTNGTNGVSALDNGSLCTPAGCMVNICYPKGSRQCKWYWCDKDGCRKVTIPPAS